MIDFVFAQVSVPYVQYPILAQKVFLVALTDQRKYMIDAKMLAPRLFNRLTILTDPYTSATGSGTIRTLHAKNEGCMNNTVLAIKLAWGSASNHEV